MTTLKKACAALLVVSTLAMITACPGSTSPASPAAAGGSGAPAGDSAASTATPTLGRIKAVGVLKVGVKADVPDFGLKNAKTGEVEGFEIDLAKAVAEDLLGDENEVETQTVTAKTRDPLLDNGEVDLVIATFTITDKRKKVYNFSDPYCSDAVKLMVKKSFDIKNLKDLNGKIVDAAQSSTSMKAIQDVTDAAGVEVRSGEYATYPEVKTMLDSDRVQYFPVDGSTLGGHVDDTATILNDKYSPREYGTASKLDNKDLVEYVNGTVAQPKSSGEPDQMIARWRPN